MSRFRNQRNWNESRWESEIRRDERRINCYFAELASCIDLPGEEEMIAEAIAENSDLVCTASSGSESDTMMRCWSYLAPRDEDIEEEDYPGRRPEQTMLDLLDTLATQWNEADITHLPEELICAGLCIACLYGKLLARMADFADSGADPDCAQGLHVTLGKRVISDIEALTNGLSTIIHFESSLEALVQKHMLHLMCVHDRVAALLNQLLKD